MQQGVYIFDSKTDFFKVLERLSKEYEPTPILELNKHLTTYNDVEKEIAFLNHCHLNSYNGFKTSNLIKLAVTGADGVRYCITYSFNNSFNNSSYDKLKKYLRKRENVRV